MPEPNRDFDLDDAFKHTKFVPDAAFKEALRGRLQRERKSISRPITFSSGGWRRLLFVQTDQQNKHDRYEQHTMQPTSRLIPAFGALILVSLIAAILVGVLGSRAPLIGHQPVEPTPTPTPSPTAIPATPEPTDIPAEFTATALQDIAGVWFRKTGATTQMMQFNLDGTTVIDWATQQNGNYVEVISTSTDSDETQFAYEFIIWFEDGLLNVQTNGGWHDPRNEQRHGIFEVTITMDGDTPATIAFIPKNDEARSFNAWKDLPWKWVGPIAPKE